MVWIELQFRDVIELVELRFDVLAGYLPLNEIVMLDVVPGILPRGTPLPGLPSDPKAARQLIMARLLLRNGLTEKATSSLRSILSDYPGTDEAEQAQKELDNIERASKEQTQTPAPTPVPKPPARPPVPKAPARSAVRPAW
jgi:hypothetical protein